MMHETLRCCATTAVDEFGSVVIARQTEASSPVVRTAFRSTSIWLMVNE